MDNRKWCEQHRRELEFKYKDSLYNLRENKHYSMTKCKQILKINEHITQIGRWCKMWGFFARKNGTKHRDIYKNITKDILNEYYIIQKKTAEECGLILKISCSQIYRLLKKHNIFIRERSDYRGENSPLWKGGPGRFPYPIGFSRPLKKYIRERDGFECQRCGKTQIENKQKLCIHHIDYIKENINEDNLTSLCRSCNTIVNFDRDRWQRHFEYLRFFKDIFSRIPERKELELA